MTPPTLHIEAQHDIALSRQQLWASLHNPQILQQCIKGCDKLERVDENSFCATFKIRVGPLIRVFHAQLNIVNAKPLAEYRLLSTMDAGIAGKLSGVADVRLKPISNRETNLHYDAQVSIDGWLGKLGVNVLSSTAERYMQRFFDKMVAITTEPTA